MRNTFSPDLSPLACLLKSSILLTLPLCTTASAQFGDPLYFGFIVLLFTQLHVFFCKSIATSPIFLYCLWLVLSLLLTESSIVVIVPMSPTHCQHFDEPRRVRHVCVWNMCSQSTRVSQVYFECLHYVGSHRNKFVGYNGLNPAIIASTVQSKTSHKNQECHIHCAPGHSRALGIALEHCE